MRYLLLLLILPASLAAQSLAGFTLGNGSLQRELEKNFLSHPFSGNNREYLLKLTEEPHIAGSTANKHVAEYIQSKYIEWGIPARLQEYRAYLPYPEEVRIIMHEPVEMELGLTEDVWQFDKDAYDNRAVMPFNAYSPSGEVMAQVVYVNRGLPEDYDRLQEFGIDIRGKIALVRYGGSFRGVKAQVAEEQGAAGLLIYSDPADDGYMRGDIYPNGPMRPWNGIQRGSLLYIFRYPGDPLSPGFASVPGAKLLEPAKATNLPAIPTAPLSYGQAQYILQHLAGPEVPDNWQGGLPFRYHVGPGPAAVDMHLKMDYQIRPIYNVIAEIRGTEEPERKIVMGNHFDAWIYGAVDPNSGTSVVMEIGRSLGEMMKSGWRPRRTIVIAHWDAEEYGLIGSTEWVEQFGADLKENAVVYLNIDSGVSGEDFGAGAVPSLDQFIREVVKEIPDPNTRLTVYEKWWKHQNSKLYKRLNGSIPDTAETNIGRLGSGSDYTAFLQYIGVPSITMGFGGRYGVYHSILDNFYWMSQWGDPSFKYHETMSKIGGLMLLRFTQADVFPFNYADYAEAIWKHLDALEKDWDEKGDSFQLDLTPLRKKVREWKDASEKLNQKIQAQLTGGSINPEINRVLMQIERRLTRPEGLPGRDWFKHRIYAPGFYTGYAAKPLPGLAEPANAGQWETAQQEMDVLLTILDEVIALTLKD